MALKYIQTKSTTLTYGISDSSTTIQLKNLLKLDGTSISASDIGDILYGTFAPGTSREEIFSIVGSNVTVESDGKITITSVSRGLKEVSPYNSGGFKCDHPANEVVIFGNNPQVYNYLKEYIDGIAIAGGIPSSDTNPGISMEATVAEIDADTAERTYNSTLYRLFINPAKLVLSKFGLRLPTADQKAALAGSQGVPNATNTYLTKDNVYDSDTDQTQTTQDSTVEFGEANATSKKNTISQSFIPTKTKIRGVRLYKSANTGTFTGNVVVGLLADSSGSPSSGSPLAEVTISNAIYNDLPVGEFEAIFSSEYTSLVVGNLYWIRIYASTSDNSNHPNLGTNTAGGYTNGSVKYWNVTDGYVSVANIDLYFKTLQGYNNQLVLNNTDSQHIFLLAGEDIGANIPVSISNGTDTGSFGWSTAQDNNALNTYEGNTITMPIDGKINSVSINFKTRTSGQNTNGYVAIYNTSAGLPTGSPLAISQTINDMPSSVNVFNVSNCPLLLKNTVYAVVFIYTQSGGSVVWYSNSSSYSGGNRVTSSDGISWLAQTSNDISITSIVHTLGVIGKVYASTAIAAGSANSFIGFSEGNATKDSLINIKISGIISSLSGLTALGTVYLSNTYGGLSMSSGTVSRKIGMAISSTSLLIKNDNI